MIRGCILLGCIVIKKDLYTEISVSGQGHSKYTDKQTSMKSTAKMKRPINTNMEIRHLRI